MVELFNVRHCRRRCGSSSAILPRAWSRKPSPRTTRSIAYSRTMCTRPRICRPFAARPWTASRCARPTRSVRASALPAYLDIVGEVFMGQAADLRLDVGECARIATGGMLPDGADAVVMVENRPSRSARTTIEALRPVAPGENVVQIGEDVRTGRSDPAARTPAATAGCGRPAGARRHRASRSRASSASASSRAATSWSTLTPSRARPDPRHQLVHARGAGTTRPGTSPCLAGVVSRRSRAARSAPRGGVRRSRRLDPVGRAAPSARAI